MASPSSLFDTSRFPARWHCGDWPEYLGWLHIISDVTIFAAYTSIPITLYFYIRNRPDIPFPLVLWLFIAFIFACGTTHLIEAIIFWYPIYPLAGLMKAVTAVVSTITVCAIIRAMPKALKLPRLAAINTRLEQEVSARANSERLLREQTELLSEQTRRLIAAQRAGRIGDWTFDPTTEKITWSQEIYRLFLRDPKLGPPQSLEENRTLYPDHSLIELNKAIGKALSGESDHQQLTLQVRRTDGNIAWHNSTIQTERDANGKVIRLWGTVQDHTEYQEALIALKRQSELLKRTNADLEQFTSMAAHDLLEPLRKSRFFADILTEDLGRELPPDAAFALERLNGSVDRMDAIVRGLQAISHLGRHGLRTEKLSLATVLKDARDHVADLSTAAQATIIDNGFQDLPDIHGDRTLLAQVFQNLIANSIKFARPAQAPEIAITATRNENDMTITVSDNGIGFNNAHKEDIFKPFIRLENNSASGTGIGLSLCQRIISAHHGHIEASSALNKGCTITITLPLTTTES